jgi:hypothetical protein
VIYKLSDDARHLLHVHAELMRVEDAYYYRKLFLPKVKDGKVPANFTTEQIGKSTTIIRTQFGARLCRVPIEALKMAIVENAFTFLHKGVCP